jgi:hypothetical protein
MIKTILDFIIAFMSKLWDKKTIDDQKEQIKTQEQVINAHEVYEDILHQEIESDSKIDSQINDLHDKVDNAKSDEEAANIVSDTLDDYFKE